MYVYEHNRKFYLKLLYAINVDAFLMILFYVYVILMIFLINVVQMILTLGNLFSYDDDFYYFWYLTRKLLCWCHGYGMY
jgi:hypothetical protein